MNDLGPVAAARVALAAASPSRARERASGSLLVVPGASCAGPVCRARRTAGTRFFQVDQTTARELDLCAASLRRLKLSIKVNPSGVKGDPDTL